MAQGICGVAKDLTKTGSKSAIKLTAGEDVGFYYAANATGRFAGTLLSGLLYTWAGLAACLVGSALMLAACWVLTLALPIGVQDRNTLV